MTASVWCLALLAFVLGCRGDDPVTPLEQGELRIVVMSTGLAIDADGYLLQVDQQPQVRIPANHELILTLPVGQHQVQIRDIAAACLPQPVSQVRFVQADRRSDLEIRLECLASGSLHIATATAGSDPDPEGYLLVINGEAPVPLATNGQLEVSRRAGMLVLELRGVAGNCQAEGSRRREIQLSELATTSVRFELSCSPHRPLGPGEYLVVSRKPVHGTDYDLFLLSADGTVLLEQLTDDPGDDMAPEWSPDGKRIAFLRQGGTTPGGPWVVMLDADTRRELRLFLVTPFPVHWSPDGQRLVLNLNGEITVARADGTVERSLTPASGEAFWSPDNQWIAYTLGPGLNTDVYLIRPDGTSPRRLTQHGGRTAGPWSPDGSAILIKQDQEFPCVFSGYGPCGFVVQDLLVVTLTDNQEHPIWTPYDERRPAWAPDGLHIFFAASDLGRADVFMVQPDGAPPLNLTRSPESEDWFSVGRRP